MCPPTLSKIGSDIIRVQWSSYKGLSSRHRFTHSVATITRAEEEQPPGDDAEEKDTLPLGCLL